ncbi:DUF4834 family protein [Candidatus Woesearchaeota archaeon]|nr:DUF4834 family protein [Candidatus Woesearchaeota archaeon]
MGITKVWRGFFYFLITIVIIAVILLLALPFALIVLVIITAIAILGFIIRFIFSGRVKSAHYNHQQGYNQTNIETKAKETAKQNIVDAEIIEEKPSEDSKNKSEAEK